MKKSYITVSLIAVTIGFFSFQRSGQEKIERVQGKHWYPDGVSGGYAGAPNDANCTQCHSGNTQDGTSVNTITLLSGSTPVTTYTPGQSYTVALTMSPNPTAKGFQAVAKNPSNGTAGTFTALGGAQGAGVHILSGRATHTSSSAQLFAWTWTAPATNVGTVTFYVASMSANGTGGTGGDQVYLSQHQFGAESGAGVEELAQNKYNFKAAYSAEKNEVVMDFNSLIAGEMYFNLVDMNGRSVYTYKMGASEIGANHETIAMPDHLKNGMYVVNMFVNNNAMSGKIMVQK